jgi:hypothetical protein
MRRENSPPARANMNASKSVRPITSSAV